MNAEVWTAVVAFVFGVGMTAAVLLVGIGIGRMSADRNLKHEVEELTAELVRREAA